MKYKIVWNMANGLPEKAFENKKSPGEYILPGGCVEIPPPEFDQETEMCHFEDGQWQVDSKSEPEKPNYDLHHTPFEDTPGEWEKPEEPASDSPELTIVESPE